jgi:phage tail sheath protein FI
MPTAVSYPGVYVEELPSGVRTITAVPTSVTAFVGRAYKGPTNQAIEITSYADFERVFGGLWLSSAMSFAVRDFYRNGGSRAVVVRIASPNYVDAAERAAGEALVKQVTDAAKAESTGAAAKAKAKTANDAIQADAANGVAGKAAAQAAYEAIKVLADDANQAAITAAVAAAGVGTLRRIEVGSLTFVAKSPGSWATALRLTITRPFDKGGNALAAAKSAASALGLAATDLFTLSVVEEAPGGASETFANVTVKASNRRIDKILANESSLIDWAGGDLDTTLPNLDNVAKTAPDAGATEEQKAAFEPKRGDAIVELQRKLAKKKAANPDPTTYQAEVTELQDAIKQLNTTIGDGPELGTNDLLPPQGEANKTGLYSLEQLFTRGGIFNLLCIPPYATGSDVATGVHAAAAAYCEKRRAMLLVDSPVAWKSIATARNNFGTDVENLPRTRNAAVFFPRLKQPNPLRGDQLEEFAPCGLVAGIFARTDAQRGVWKSPAGLDTSLVGVSALSVPMTDEENGLLNPLGINCLRTFPVFGRVVWGARTLRGADDYADEYKYIAVRRTALYIEESLYRGLKWVVFEPNDEPLWAQIRLNVGAFMQDLFRQGAFQGASARDAYFVKCDATTTTQNDINLGVVNVHVGFAPLKPAEFVIIKLQQIAGQIET